MAKNLATCHTLGGRATYELDNSPCFVVVVLTQTVWVGENLAPAEEVGFLQRVYSMDPVPSLAPTAPEHPEADMLRDSSIFQLYSWLRGPVGSP